MAHRGVGVPNLAARYSSFKVMHFAPVRQSGSVRSRFHRVVLMPLYKHHDRYYGSAGTARVTLALWELGLYVRRGTSSRPAEYQDLARPGVRDRQPTEGR